MPIFFFIFGLIVGSFLNAVIYRLNSGQSILIDSSRCPYCGHRLAAIDLIPVISFFILRRRCRYCGKPISWQYPAVEIITAVSFSLIYAIHVIPVRHGGGIQDWIPGSSPRMTDSLDLLFQLIFLSFLIVIFVYDLKHYLILDKIVFPAAALAAVYQLWQGNILMALLGAAILSSFFAALFFLSSGRWIGFGDVKLGVFLGLLIPWPATLALFFLAYLSGAIFGLCSIAWGSKTLKDRLPFGTFLTLATFFAMLWGEEMVGWYLSLIGLK